MYPRKPLPYTEQLARLKRYLRRSRTALRRRYDEFFEATKGRRDCPLEVRIRQRAIEHAQDTVKLLEACVEEVLRQEAIFYAPYKPGDRIVVGRNVGDGDEASGPYLIVDVLPDKKTRYAYECVALTKDGAMYKRGGDRRIRPDVLSKIRASDALQNAEGRWEAEYFRRCAETSHLLAIKSGDIALFEARKGLVGLISYRRKDRLD
jgi:hypothetical protein